MQTRNQKKSLDEENSPLKKEAPETLKNAMTMVIHRGTEIPIRLKEVPIWRKMSFSEREDMLKSYRTSIGNSATLVKGGFLVKKKT